MENILDFIKLHWDEILAAYGLLVAFASIIVKMTPTLADDTLLLKVTKFVSTYIALNRATRDDAVRKLEK